MATAAFGVSPETNWHAVLLVPLSVLWLIEFQKPLVVLTSEVSVWCIRTDMSTCHLSHVGQAVSRLVEVFGPDAIWNGDGGIGPVVRLLAIWKLKGGGLDQSAACTGTGYVCLSWLLVQ
ncbi:hypothetical protein AMTR_s00060p00156410 [Amborella trichopoda]|uniref:Uncharacterized protein n=1 Tax=Amborella trichopoda TaxID=13333 RepID=W1NKX4_AMBTC|nr:hypothetical protein AMTR_s00060p00156410 [Amborella trichopoda]